MKFDLVRDVIVETLNCDLSDVTEDARLREDLHARLTWRRWSCAWPGRGHRRHH